MVTRNMELGTEKWTERPVGKGTGICHWNAGELGVVTRKVELCELLFAISLLNLSLSASSVT